MSGKIFISHATADDGFVKRLREALEGANLPVWVDSRVQTGGDELLADVKKAIEQARAVPGRPQPEHRELELGSHRGATGTSSEEAPGR